MSKSGAEGLTMEVRRLKMKAWRLKIEQWRELDPDPN
jgi:hypothetical protein